MKDLLKEIFLKVKKREFSSNTGIAIKNTIYQTISSWTGNIGSLIFTILIARLLMPDLFGLYSLAFSTILIFGSISDLGVGQTLIRFVSLEISKNKVGKAKSYLYYFGKVKLVLALISVLVLAILARYISQTYYNKPIYLALLAGIFYLIFLQITVFLQAILQAINYFKGLFHKEIAYQVLRLFLITPFLLLIPKINSSTDTILFILMLLLSLVLLLTGVFLVVIVIRRINFFSYKKKDLTKREYKKVNKFLFWTSTLTLSGLFFTYIDKIMLGHFVSGEFIGYYEAAFVLIASGLTPTLYGAIAGLFPIFSRMKGRIAQGGFMKSVKVILLLSFIFSVLTFLLAKFIILIIYGNGYENSINVLRLAALLIIPLSLNSIYSTYLLSQDKPHIVAWLLASSTIITIIFNYILITSLLVYSPMAAVYGVVIAALIGQLFYLGGLLYYYNKTKK